MGQADRKFDFNVVSLLPISIQVVLANIELFLFNKSENYSTKVTGSISPVVSKTFPTILEAG